MFTEIFDVLVAVQTVGDIGPQPSMAVSIEGINAVATFVDLDLSSDRPVAIRPIGDPKIIGQPFSNIGD